MTVNLILVASAVLVICAFVYAVIISPYLKLRYYRKQGIKTEFFPIVGNMMRDHRNTLKKGDFFHAWKYTGKEPAPKLIAKNVGTHAELILMDPNLIKEFTLNHDRYMKHPELFGLFIDLLGNGLIFAEGSHWKKHRKIISLSFHFELLTEMIPSIVSITEEFLDRIEKKDTSKVAILDEFQAITGEVIGRIFFGKKFADYKFRGHSITSFLGDLIARVSNEFFTPLYLLFGKKLVLSGLLPRHRKLLKDLVEFRNFCIELIRDRMNQLRADPASNQKKSMIELLMANSTSAEGTLTEDEVINEFMTFFLAGMDTTSHLVAIATYYALKEPEQKERLMNEINKFFEDPSKINIETLNKMEFTTAFLKETLRIASPAMVVFPRKAIVDHKLGEYHIKKDTLLVSSFVTNNFNPAYHDDPEKFDPDRWLTPSKTQKSIASNAFVFTPFSAGGRNCIGQHLAMNEARILLGLFLKKFTYKLSDPNFKLKLTHRFMYEPLEEIKYTLSRRE